MMTFTPMAAAPMNQKYRKIGTGYFRPPSAGSNLGFHTMAFDGVGEEGVPGRPERLVPLHSGFDRLRQPEDGQFLRRDE
jgi:hypothetical protein